MTALERVGQLAVVAFLYEREAQSLLRSGLGRRDRFGRERFLRFRKMEAEASTARQHLRDAIQALSAEELGVVKIEGGT